MYASGKEFMLPTELLTQLTVCAENLFRDAGVLKPNQTVRVSVDIVDNPAVMLKVAIAAKSDEAVLRSVLKRMPLHRLWARRLAENIERDIELKDIRGWVVGREPKFLLCGRTTYLKLAQAFVAAGVPCSWADEYIKKYGARPVSDTH